ncbi:hypothetical protein PC119_g12429 [Phytophthora cactorum]|uniref:Uncharacterized protein n=1 Tax=Phytophthora cactorum TaxID=29920 RepID=A0A8T1CY24_9STRA|nr:hypothetical protein PC117_g13375 [Phytophthora cactorum]KAG3013624.1 hypothetical protein PC119_g12429 [Phytophthora cactorum]
MEMETGNEEFELCRAGLPAWWPGRFHEAMRDSRQIGQFAAALQAGTDRGARRRVWVAAHAACHAQQACRAEITSDLCPSSTLTRFLKICSYSSWNTMVPSIARPSTANVDEKKTTYKSEL